MGWPYSFGDNPIGHVRSKKTIIPVGSDYQYKVPRVLQVAGDASMTISDLATYAMHIMNMSKKITSNTNKNRKGSSKSSIIGITKLPIPLLNLYYIDGSAGTYYARIIWLGKKDFGLSILTNIGDEKVANRISISLMVRKIFSR